MVGPRHTVLGAVLDFDPEVGLGTIDAADGSSVSFHCTAITDGTRAIDPGRAVTFDVGPAGPGRWEALRVTPLPG